MRLIDADALMDRVCANLRDGDVLDRIPPCFVDNAPTVDAVVVTRCKDCEHMAGASPNDKGFLICPASGMEIIPDDFCSYGEPKEGDHA